MREESGGHVPSSSDEEAGPTHDAAEEVVNCDWGSGVCGLPSVLGSAILCKHKHKHARTHELGRF